MCLTTFFVFTTLFLSTFQSCPDGTIQGLNADDCYYFVKNGSDSGSQFEQYCGFNDFANGSKILAYGQWTSVLSAFENNFILQQAQTYLQSDYHIGMTRKYPNYDGNHCFDYYWQDGNNLTYTNWANSEPQSCANNVLSTVSVNINTGKWYASSVVSIVNNSGVVNWAPLVCKVPAQAPKCVDHVNGTQGFMLPLYNPAYYALTKKCYYNVYVMPDNITNGYIVNKDSCASATKDLTLSHFTAQIPEEASFMARFNDYGGTVSYIGLFYSTSTNSWNWFDGSTLNVTHWDTGYPQDPTNNQCAGYVYPNGGQTQVESNTDGYPKWRNFPCDTSKVGHNTVTIFCQAPAVF